MVVIVSGTAIALAAAIAWLAFPREPSQQCQWGIFGPAQTQIALPDMEGSEMGAGFGITGFVQRPDGEWFALNGSGRVDEGDKYTSWPSIIQMSPDFEIEHIWRLHEILNDGKHTHGISLQGLGFREKTGLLYAVAKDDWAMGRSKVVVFDPTIAAEQGAEAGLVSVIPVEDHLNGLTVDNLTDRLISLSPTTIRERSWGSMTPIGKSMPYRAADHIFHDAGSNKLIVTKDGNPSSIEFFLADPSIEKSFSLGSRSISTRSIEGVYLKGCDLYVGSNERFHRHGPRNLITLFGGSL